MDPNVERNSTATRKTIDALFCYSDAKRIFQENARPPCCSFSRKPVEDVVPEDHVDDPVEAVEAEEAQVDDDVLDSEVDSDGKCL
ncbi:hypothetical protein E2C01_055976 [Portunus trituberculatus]|uniref:Uncharacterized protein n=1 Tax=Portunus trituberculatus TaxID=210409 RepID=A0A5B7GWM8_PORTR|nr:hypothetical protein [Portunus trituberculatus]